MWTATKSMAGSWYDASKSNVECLPSIHGNGICTTRRQDVVETNEMERKQRALTTVLFLKLSCGIERPSAASGISGPVVAPIYR